MIPIDICTCKHSDKNNFLKIQFKSLKLLYSYVSKILFSNYRNLDKYGKSKCIKILSFERHKITLL